MSFFAKNDIVDVDIPGMNKKTLLWIISLIILSILTSYGTLYYLKQREMKLWEKERQKETQEKELTEEEKELNILREEAEKRLSSETGELIQTKEELKELEILRLEAEKRLETKEPATQTKTTPQAEELTLEQRREEAMKRLQNQ